MTIIEQIKTAIKIEDLIAETYQVKGSPPPSATRTTAEHDSLIIWPATGTWHWFSRGIGGDILDWWQHTHNCDLNRAIEDLAARANIERRPLTPQETQQRTHKAAHRRILQLAAAHHHHTLTNHPAAEPARTWCASRGWTPATLQREQIGYVLPPQPPEPPKTPDDKHTLSAPPHPLPSAESAAAGNPLTAPDLAGPLSTQLRKHGLIDHPTASAVLSLPAGHIVYTHRHAGAVTYLSARSITAKRHWNLPADLAGGKQPYHNTPATLTGPTLNGCILVEGQADAIALGQLGLPAIALCGLGDPTGLTSAITHIALDNDRAGIEKSLDTALAIDPLTRIAQWPEGIKDAAQLLADHPATARDTALAALTTALTALEALAIRIRRTKGDQRHEQLRRLLDLVDTLDQVTAADLKQRLAISLGESISQFNRLLTARRKEREADERDNNQQPSPRRYEYSAGGAAGPLVWEQCVIPDDKGALASSFAVRHPDGRIEHQPFVDVGDTTFTPYPASMDLITKRVVIFPAAASEYGSQRELLRSVQDFVHTYLDIDPFFERLAAYYILFTWLYDCFENLPYLRALGDYGTGKTRFIQTIGALCYRPMFCSGAATVSPIFRIIDMFAGTLIIDEADLTSSDAENELIKIFNVGYYKGGNVLRSKKDPNQDTDEYWPSANNVYCPKIFATRKPFTDRATESRCLTKRMGTARPRPGIPFTIDRHFWLRSAAIRNQLLMYRLRNHRDIDLDQNLADPSIEPRLNQVTMALKSVVDDDMRRDLDTFVRAYNDLLIADRQMTVPAILVQALVKIHTTPKHDIFGKDDRDYTMKGIADIARKILEEIDPDIKLTPKAVSKALTEDLGLARRAIHPETRRTMLIFDDAELHALMLRFGLTQEEDQNKT